MTYLKHFAAVAVAFAATNAFAVAQSFNAISATVTVDQAAVAASLNGYTPSGVGGATYNSTTGVVTFTNALPAGIHTCCKSSTIFI